MKTKKIIALTLSLAMVLGVVAACNQTNESDASAASDASEATTAAPDASDATTAAPESQAPEAQVSEFTELTVADVSDEGDGVLVYGWNDEFPGLVAKYSQVDIGDPVLTESNSYQAKLDQVLDSGEDAPDLFVCDADYASKYMNSDNTLPINDLGISYDELSEMYNYTLQFATDNDNVIKGLAWQACPCGVFYNRTLAETYLGTQDPDELAAKFATWDAFLESAREVNTASNGEVKIVSGLDDVWRAYLNTREQGWIVDGELYIDPVMEDYFDMAKALYDEDLTFQTSQWGDAWNANMANQTVVTYWGPMWLLNFCMGFQDGSNPTKGDWGITTAPGNFFWGGTWMMASTYCDMKASVAQIMRDIAIDEANLQDMAEGGEFVNNISIMTELAGDDSFGVENLGGQNPLPALLAAATTIDNSTVGENDQAINDAFNTIVNSYVQGDIASVPDAETQFEAALEEAGII